MKRIENDAKGSKGKAGTGAERLFPVMLRLSGRRCLVIGGGTVAARKIADLKAAEALVTVVAAEVSEAARQAQPDEILQQVYDSSLLDGVMLVFAATDDAGLNERISADCRERGVWCNVVDVPQLCDFYMPAVHRCGRLTLAISSSGASPAAAVALRDHLAACLGDGVELWLDALAEMRRRLLNCVSDARLRRSVMLRLAEADMLGAAGEGAAALDAKIRMVLREHDLPENWR